MAELLDPDGIWSMDLVELMLPVAIELEADDTERTFGAVASAAASLFSKVPAQKLAEQLRQTRERVKAKQLAARGIEAPRADAAAGFMAIFEKMGLKPKKRRSKGGTTGPTRVHRS